MDGDLKLGFGAAFARQRRRWSSYVTIFGAVASIVALFLKFWEANPGFTSVVSALVLVLAIGIVLTLTYQRALTDALRKRDELLRDPTFIHGCVCENYGLVKEYYSVQTQIAADGSATAVIEQSILALTHDVDAIEYGYTIDAPSPGLIDLVRIKSHNAPRHTIKVEPTTSVQAESKVFVIKFEGPILPGEDEAVAFQLVRSSPPGTFAMDPKDLPIHRGYEFSRQRISYPTRKLHLEFAFPPGFDLSELRAEAHYGIAGVEHAAEAARLKGGNVLRKSQDGDHIIATFDLKYPIHGLTYVVKWRPKGFQASRTEPAR